MSRRETDNSPARVRSPARSAQNARCFLPTACLLQPPLAMSCRSSDLLTYVYPDALAPYYKAPSTSGPIPIPCYSLLQPPQHHPIPHINSTSVSEALSQAWRPHPSSSASTSPPRVSRLFSYRRTVMLFTNPRSTLTATYHTMGQLMVPFEAPVLEKSPRPFVCGSKHSSFSCSG